jgi:hypothetical protein
LTRRRGGTKLKGPKPPDRKNHVEVDEMAEERRQSKCARETCGCPAAQGSKYCSEECEDASKVHMMEIGCTCHHPDCK